MTDSTSAAGMPDGEYQLGTHEVYKERAVTLKMALAGSAAADLVVLRKFRIGLGRNRSDDEPRPTNWLGWIMLDRLTRRSC